MFEIEEYPNEKWRLCECAECGTRFAAPLLTKRLEDGETFYCPVGHSQYYTRARRAKEEQEALRKMLLAPEPTPKPKEKKDWLSVLRG